MGKYLAVLRQSDGWLSANQFNCIITSWPGLQQWWQRRQPGEYAIGLINYNKTVWFGITRHVEHLKTIPQTVGKGRDPSLQHGLTKIILPNKRTYQSLFTAAQNYLRVGDIYQVNLALPITAQYDGDPSDLFSQWYHQQPTPYATLLQTPRWSIVSNSPELGLQLEPHGQNYLATTQPMKGTSKRSANKNRLKDSPKEQAELDMIIDVHRNDLARIAKPGSVRVVKRRQIISFSTVHQAQAVITAIISKQHSPIDIVRSFFPAGSVTGAPKLRAQAIIDEFEPVKRGVYCGAIGYINWRGQTQFNVAIRTATIKQHQLSYLVGSGITLAAQAKAEYNELLTKAALLHSYEK